MGISDFLKEKIKNMGSPTFGRDDDIDPLDDFETRDKSLRAMRRLRRRQIDIIEKRTLKKTMDAFQRAKDRDDFIGESSFDSRLDGSKVVKKKVVKSSFFGATGGFLGKGRF